MKNLPKHSLKNALCNSYIRTAIFITSWIRNYEQFAVEKTLLGDALNFLKENMNLELLTHKGVAIGVELPVSVELKIVETGPGFKGNTASAGGKPAKMETGITIQVPFFLNTDDVIKVDTRTGEYLERV